MNLRTSKMANEYPVRITSLSLDHPLRAHLSPESLGRIHTTGLPAEIVCARKVNEPTALHYLGMAWTIRGVDWERA